jgi:hypothetical protein
MDYKISSNSSSNSSTFVYSELFQPITINNILFRAGTSVVFEDKAGSNLDVSNVSYPTYTNSKQLSYVAKVYKVRLLQQLTNGFIDLTTDI